MNNRFHLLSLVLLCVLGQPAGAVTRTFSDPGTISVPGAASPGSASTYPATITVSDAAGFLHDVDVTVHGLSHAWPSDVGIILQSPSGHAVWLVRGGGTHFGVTNVDVGLDQQSRVPLPAIAQIESGVYRPTIGHAATVLAPAPIPAPSAGGLDDFRQTDPNPNGDWKLWVMDNPEGDAGAIGGGWSLTLTTARSPVPASASTAALTVISALLLADGSPAPLGCTGTVIGTVSVNATVGSLRVGVFKMVIDVQGQFTLRLFDEDNAAVDFLGTIAADGSFQLGLGGAAGTADGSIDASCEVSGTWSSAATGVDGTFTGQRATGPFAGIYGGSMAGDETGTWALAVDNSGQIAGLGSLASQAGFFYVNGAVLSDGSTSGGAFFGLGFASFFDGRFAADGTVTATWLTPASGASGALSGVRR